MQVIPAINCEDFGCVGKRLSQIKEFGSGWVHFDVSDGKFVSARTWNEPGELNSQLTTHNLQLSIEVHLMVQEPEEYIGEWVKAGAKRIIVHIEAVENSKIKIQKSKLQIKNKKCELGFALKPDTPVERIFPYLTNTRFVQCLAVTPGFSGKKFQEAILDKVKTLRARDKDVTIEVDGGITPEVVKRAEEAGADIVVSGSYIFNAENSREAYQKLVET